MSEDCLYLSIWSPPTANGSTPVMVFFHGGEFEEGGIGVLLYNGSHLASQQDVVIVTVQYRLGVLGFLALGPIEGQFGMMLFHTYNVHKYIQVCLTSALH